MLRHSTNGRTRLFNVVKCGGEHPVCNRCTIRREACNYKLGPTLSYTQRLERRIAELESQLSIRSPSDVSTSSKTGADSSSALREISGNFGGLGVDERGVTFQGSTSFFQLPREILNSLAETVPRTVRQTEDGLGLRERLVTNAWKQRMLESLAETPEPFNTLIQNHWVWINPLFNFIYRPAFTRDMEVLGPYYSHMLLNAMLSHSVRWCKADPDLYALLEPYDGGSLFGRQARTLLHDEIVNGQAKIPTIQTLLLLSAQENSQGSRTQAWLYSGMAFRLVEEMGINIDSQRYAGLVQLSDEDVEIRRRLFWSCYFYDKMISLYLGRSPSMQHSHVSPPQIMLDDSSENELWSPYGVTYPKGAEYPPTPARSISCFMHMCPLSVILNQILVHLYNPFRPNTDADIEGCVEREGHALSAWWDDLPVFLRIDPKNLPYYCPPSHIVTLNCLYHAFRILLYRPMLSRGALTTSRRPDPEHFIECVSSATSIIAIFDLFCRSFGYNRCVLSLAYSVYTAASIFLLQVQAATTRDDQAFRRLEFCMRGLDRVKEANPIIADALSLITQELSKIDSSLASITAGQSIFLHESQQEEHTDDEEHAIIQHSQVFDHPDETSLLQEHEPTREDFSFDDIQITPQMFEAFSSLEPISATVGALEKEMGYGVVTTRATSNFFT
ncbi:hypothetical protein B7463_g6803, partial [Scytalidium lignicola]